jgi:phosphatidylserine/phosphatidylglycerophosphate/cardiolipin synthase-like enzyme
MNRLFSNGPSKDFVLNPFNRLIGKSTRLHLAAPYFTFSRPVLDAARAGKVVQLLVGLNEATSPQSLSEVHQVPNLAVRYLTRRFHAKIFIFDDAALVGSSNLTDGGLISNREAVICLDQPDDLDTVEEVRALFLELWESGQVLTTEKLKAFADAIASITRNRSDSDIVIERAVGRAEPVNINVASRTQTRERIFLEELRRQVYEQYRPAFTEVMQILEERGLHRAELKDVGRANEANRFLNWVRLTYVLGDEAWQSAQIKEREVRRAEIARVGSEWVSTEDHKIPDD